MSSDTDSNLNNNNNNNIIHQGHTPQNMNIPEIKRKSFLNKFLCGVYFVIQTFDNIIEQMYNLGTSTFDKMIQDSESELIKRILLSKQILFYIVTFTNFYMIFMNFNLNESLYHDESLLLPVMVLAKKLFYFLFLLSSIVSAVLILILKLPAYKAMYVTRYEELENFLLSKNKEFIKNQCEICKVIRCMRSVHCHICNKCVLKYEMHSNWFHTCIGSMNCLIYLTLIVVLNFYLFSSLSIISTQVFYFPRDSQFYNIKGKEFAFHLWTILLVYLSFKMFLFTWDFIKMGTFKNLTDYEGYNWRKLSYLWKSLRKDYFNPFDKGIIGNLKELFVSFCNLNPQPRKVSPKDRNITCSDLSTDDDVLIVENSKKKNDEEKPIESEHLKIEDEKTLFITNDKSVIYEKYTGDKSDLINWNRTRFYSILDLINSPFREIVLKMNSTN